MGLKVKFVFLFILSLVIAVSTYYYLNSLKETAQVVVAAKLIPAKTKITEDMVKSVTVGKKEKELIARKAFMDITKVVGLVTKEKIDADDPIKKDPQLFVFSEEIKSRGLINNNVDDRYFVTAEKRVINVMLDSEGALGDQIRKGDIVDVIFTSPDEKTGGIYSVMILQAIEIFNVQLDQGVSSGVGGSKEAIKTVGLLVTPDQAVKVALAKRKGKIDLTLNPNKNTLKQKVIYAPSVFYSK